MNIMIQKYNNTLFDNIIKIIINMNFKYYKIMVLC